MLSSGPVNCGWRLGRATQRSYQELQLWVRAVHKEKDGFCEPGQHYTECPLTKWAVFICFDSYSLHLDHPSDVCVTGPFVTFPSFRSLHKCLIVREAFPSHLHPITHTHCHSQALSSASCVSVPFITTWHILIMCCLFWSLQYPLNLEQCQAYGKGSTHWCRMNDLLKNKIFSSTTHDWSERALMTNRGSIGHLWGDRYIGAFQSQHSPPIPRGCNRNISFLNLYPVWLLERLWPPAHTQLLPVRVYMELPDGLSVNLQARTL